VMGCATQDAACLNLFITNFGRRALRRPLQPAEIAQFAALATREKDFYVGVGQVLQAMLSDWELLYRVEIGTPAGSPDLLRMSSWEMASRLSLLLWGTTPSDDLLALAEKDALRSPAEVGKTAKAMLDGTLGGSTWGQRARDRVNRFHAMWLGYDGTISETSP